MHPAYPRAQPAVLLELCCWAAIAGASHSPRLSLDTFRTPISHHQWKLQRRIYGQIHWRGTKTPESFVSWTNHLWLIGIRSLLTLRYRALGHPFPSGVIRDPHLVFRPIPRPNITEPPYRRTLVRGELRGYTGTGQI
ncbi:hypothetical protein Y1Q_0005456 [Alligator mississippiensis]|uniref:Secreted protein n=1 Tax=Alligator mississippiensis TaxID=8496 RepID=A0A151MEI6_ALLMI|nr:hypothetical protein Y1Q_0005456 [Alligator mississippiensis]